jgi:hypothetical protein
MLFYASSGIFLSFTQEIFHFLVIPPGSIGSFQGKLQKFRSNSNCAVKLLYKRQGSAGQACGLIRMKGIFIGRVLASGFQFNSYFRTK